MGEAGSAHGRFQRAVERGNLLAAEAAARELRRMDLSDAFAYSLLLAQKDAVRFERAAVRWHGRVETEVRGLSLDDSALLLAALRGLTKPMPTVSLQAIASIAESARIPGLARVATQHLPRGARR